MKMLNLCVLGISLLLTISASAVKAETITVTFDDLTNVPTLGESIPNGYNSFDWTSFGVMNTAALTADVGPNGYANGLVSSPNIALNSFGNQAFISSTTPFSFDSAYFIAAWNNGLSITIDGFLNGVQQDTSTFTVNATGPATLETFDWANIDELEFTSGGGTPAGFTPAGTEFGMDNLTVTLPNVPEPPTWVFLGTGILTMLGFLKLASRATRPTTQMAQ